MKTVVNLLLIASFIGLSGCGQIKNIMDGTEKLPDQISETNRGMAKTNESIRKQTIEVSLKEMQNKENRAYLTPVPGDMMPYGRTMAQALTAEEFLLWAKSTIKKVNEENFSNRYPTMAADSPEYAKTLQAFEHDKLADLMMVAIVAGFLPDSTLQEIIATESEQGAYRDVLYQALMLRVMFNGDLMLNASVLNSKLETVGKINKAIEYNEKVDYIAKLEFADQIGLKVTGFVTPEMNSEMKLDTTVAATNWNRILTAAQADFKSTSFKKDQNAHQQSLDQQSSEFTASVEKIKSYLKTWNAVP